MGNVVKRLAYAAQVAAVVGGAVMGTISVCGLAEDIWGVTGWLISVASAVHLFSARRDNANRRSPPPSIIVRVLLASIAVLCLTFLTTLLTACGQPQVCGPADKIAILIFVVVGTLSAAIAMKMTWK